MRSLNDIQATLNKHKNHLFNEYPLKSMAIFGSYSRQENKELSDLDLIVEFNDKIGIRFIDLADEIEKIVGVKVDLVSKNGLKEKYRKAIDNDLIYV
ncbi:MAG: nucleotidyltransferase family protein [Bacteroidales bacterium]